MLFKQQNTLVDLSRYTDQGLYALLVDFTQHLCNCATPSGRPHFESGIPFVIVWPGSGESRAPLAKNCRPSEIQWLLESFDPAPEPLRSYASFDITIHRVTELQPLVSSFKRDLFANNAVSLFFDFKGEAGEPITIQITAPWNKATAHGFVRDYEVFLKQVAKNILDVDKLVPLRPTRVRPNEDNTTFSSRPLPFEEQSSFAFLDRILEEAHQRIVYKLPSSGDERSLWYATFLFRTQESTPTSPRYKYIFTKHQRDSLRSMTVGSKLIDAILSDSQDMLRGLDPDSRARLVEWYKSQSSATALDLLSRGEWYGDYSFAGYLSATSGSLYISDWRYWYPKGIFRSTQERDQWIRPTLVGNDAFSPFLRNLRSEVEESILGLKGMLLVGIPDPEYPEAAPIGIVQIASTDLQPHERVQLLAVVSCYATELAGYLLADTLQDEIRRREKAEQFVQIAHLLSHAGTKLFSTPLANSFTRISSGSRDGRIRGIDGIDRWALQDGQRTVDALQVFLSQLRLFGGPVSSDKTLVTEQVDWDMQSSYCYQHLETVFFRHFWNVIHDPRYAHFRNLLSTGRLKVEAFVTFGFTVHSRLPVSYASNDLLNIHLGNILENAVEALDLRRAAEDFKSGRRSKCDLQVVVTHKTGWISVETKGSGILLEKEVAVLTRLSQIFSELKEGYRDAFLRDFRLPMQEREFTTKSGGGHGWALLQLASFLKRIEVHTLDSNQIRAGYVSIKWCQGPRIAVVMHIPCPISADERPLFLQYR